MRNPGPLFAGTRGGWLTAPRTLRGRPRNPRLRGKGKELLEAALSRLDRGKIAPGASKYVGHPHRQQRPGQGSYEEDPVVGEVSDQEVGPKRTSRVRSTPR